MKRNGGTLNTYQLKRSQYEKTTHSPNPNFLEKEKLWRVLKHKWGLGSG